MEQELKVVPSPTRQRRVKHRCGHFLGEIKDGVLHVTCGRCKEQVVIDLDKPSKDLRIVAK